MALRARGLELVGWVANMMDAEPSQAQTLVDALGQHLGAPCLAQIPRLLHSEVAEVAAQFPIQTLLAALRR